jgi:hypothetical protein
MTEQCQHIVLKCQPRSLKDTLNGTLVNCETTLKLTMFSSPTCRDPSVWTNSVEFLMCCGQTQWSFSCVMVSSP